MTTIARKYANLDAFRPEFRAVVLAHMQKLPADEWTRLRTIGEESPCGLVPPLPRLGFDASHEVVLDESLSEASTCVDDVLSTSLGDKAVSIGEVAGEPVWYIEGEGVYLWGPARMGEFTLECWITHPAYPPGW